MEGKGSPSTSPPHLCWDWFLWEKQGWHRVAGVLGEVPRKRIHLVEENSFCSPPCEILERFFSINPYRTRREGSGEGGPKRNGGGSGRPRLGVGSGSTPWRGRLGRGLGAAGGLSSPGAVGGLPSLGTSAPTRCIPAAGWKPVPLAQGTEASFFPTHPRVLWGVGASALP